MKELTIKDDYYLEEYDIHVHPYLSLAEIDIIVKGICGAGNDYADRKMTKDMLVLFHGTDMTKEEIETTEYDVLNKSGLIEDVEMLIRNYHLIDEALAYTESFTRSIVELAPKIIPFVEKLGALNGKATDKK